MKTASEVLAEIDRRLLELEEDAAVPCIEALLEPVDEEMWKEALRRGMAYKAIVALRSELAEKMAAPPRKMRSRRPFPKPTQKV
jgi:hypothetical protein